MLQWHKFDVTNTQDCVCLTPGSYGAHEAFYSVFWVCVCVREVIVVNRLLWAFFRAKQKLEQLWCALHCGRCVCVFECVGVRDDEGVAHSTGHVCGKHCMHTKDRWKGRSGWAGSEEQKKHIIWFIRRVQIGLIRWRKTIMEEKEKVAASETERVWRRQRDWETMEEEKITAVAEGSQQ